jgi:hypothetical protein
MIKQAEGDLCRIVVPGEWAELWVYLKRADQAVARLPTEQTTVEICLHRKTGGRCREALAPETADYYVISVQQAVEVSTRSLF